MKDFRSRGKRPAPKGPALAKSPKHKPRPYLDPPRCAVCGTSVTLYPPGWALCPACGRSVCRQCWGENWTNKTFDAQQCSHGDGSMGPAVVPIGEKVRRGTMVDWSYYSIISIVALLVLVILYLLWDLFF